MRKAMWLLASSVVAVAGFASVAMTEPMGHKMLTPHEVKWAPGPASLPAGAEAAILYGDPSAEGLFAMRLKLPKGFRIAPHTHPKPEIVTVISGTFRLGTGDKVDDSKAAAFGAGSFIALAPGMVHYASADDDTVVQLNSTGPWAVNYVNPKDDPRLTK